MLPVVVVRGPFVCVGAVVAYAGVLRTECGGVFEITRRVVVEVSVIDSDRPN